MTLALFVVLLQGAVTAPKGHWTSVPFSVEARNSTLSCSFEVLRGSSKVEVIIATEEEGRRFQAGHSFTALASTGFTKGDRLRVHLEEAGRYAAFIDNRLEGRFDAVVRVELHVFSPNAVGARTLPADRRRVVVTISLLLFGAIVVFSARQFLRTL